MHGETETTSLFSRQAMYMEIIQDRSIIQSNEDFKHFILHLNTHRSESLTLDSQKRSPKHHKSLQYLGIADVK